MKHLLVMWDPANPLVPVTSVVEALKALPDVRATMLTYSEVGHSDLPNRAFELLPVVRDTLPDGIVWIEGGPFPSDLERFRCPKVCWLVNTHLEPTLLDEFGPSFGCVFSASLRDSEEEGARWLPLPSSVTVQAMPPKGISLLIDDPRPPSHMKVQQALRSLAGDLDVSTSVVVSIGNAGQVHPMLADCLRAGAVVVADPESDLRGIAHPGDHLEVYPDVSELGAFIRRLLKDPERLSRLRIRGQAIAEHLHRPEMRAERLRDALWPRHAVVSGADYRPVISVLVTCYRYARRLRVCLESLSRQDLPSGSIEVVVADPESPDDVRSVLEECASRNPDLRLVHLPLPARYHRNRGFGINRAFEISVGEVVVAIDGDIVFPPHLIGKLASHAKQAPSEVFGVCRTFLPRKATEDILAGRIEPFGEFDRLSLLDGDGEEHPFVGVLGYCQAVDRKAFAKARYPEEFDMVNQSDIVFVERLERRAGVHPRILANEKVLHLWHPRNWSGTSELL